MRAVIFFGQFFDLVCVVQTRVYVCKVGLCLCVNACGEFFGQFSESPRVAGPLLVWLHTWQVLFGL